MTIYELLKAVSTPRPPLRLARDNTVLLLIDMQRMALGEYLVHEAEEKGIDGATAKAACADYDARSRKAVLKAKRLLETFRERDMTPVHVRIESYAGDARDTGPSHRRVGFLFPPGNRWAEFIEEVAPVPGEIILSKTCSGAVVGCGLDKVLRNLGARYVIAVGFYTDQCVETTVRDLHDLGYDVTLAVDATESVTPERYEGTMRTCVGVYCRGLASEQVLAELQGIEPKPQR